MRVVNDTIHINIKYLFFSNNCVMYSETSTMISNLVERGIRLLTRTIIIPKSFILTLSVVMHELWWQLFILGIEKKSKSKEGIHLNHCQFFFFYCKVNSLNLCYWPSYEKTLRWTWYMFKKQWEEIQMWTVDMCVHIPVKWQT